MAKRLSKKTAPKRRPAFKRKLPRTVKRRIAKARAVRKQYSGKHHHTAAEARRSVASRVKSKQRAQRSKTQRTTQPKQTPARFSKRLSSSPAKSIAPRSPRPSASVKPLATTTISGTSVMKLHLEPNLDYQLAAIESVCGLFHGQETCRTEFTVTRDAADAQTRLTFAENDLGIGNRLTLLDDELLANLHGIQLRHGLAPSPSLASGDFTVEMETGTGKTYVYLRTIFELNKLYGFTKFVIVVPSVAIKEGVYKTLQITEEHFKGLYSGQPYDYFLYDSAKLGQVRNFATSPNIQIMVVTVGAINKKDVNNLYKDSEKTGGERPIDLIRATHPILIVDEPQSVDGGLSGAGKNALGEMNPLCTLRYSATHVEKHHMVYRLDAVDAYERKLVKQIEVASLEVEGGHNKAYVRFISASNAKGPVTARVEIDLLEGKQVRRKEMVVQDGDDLEELTKRAVYADCRIGEIRSAKDTQLLEVKLPGGETFLSSGEAVGDVDADAMKRLMIRRTIQEHLEKEKRLAPLGIKVLSLFFIDAVEHYRSYDE